MNVASNILGRIKDALSKDPIERIGDHAGDVATKEAIEGLAKIVLALRELSPEGVGLLTGEKTWLVIDAPDVLAKPIRIAMQLKQDGEE